MADVELLPLPEGERASDMYWDAQVYGRDEMHAYARANLAPLQAENERLREQVRELDRVRRTTFEIGRKHAARAERLAEALRGKAGIWESEGIRLNGGATKPYTDDENSIRAFVLGCCADELRALLRD